MNNGSNDAPRARRVWSPTTKLQILKEGRSKATTLSAVCDHYAITLPQFYAWERQAERGALHALSPQPRGRKRCSPDEEQQQIEIEKLRAVIAELSAENLELKRGRWR
jgi:transposase-like protein